MHCISALTTLDDLRTMNRAYKNEYLAFITAVLNVILWIVPLLFPYIQVSTFTDYPVSHCAMYSPMLSVYAR